LLALRNKLIGPADKGLTGVSTEKCWHSFILHKNQPSLNAIWESYRFPFLRTRRGYPEVIFVILRSQVSQGDFMSRRQGTTAVFRLLEGSAGR